MNFNEGMEQYYFKYYCRLFYSKWNGTDNQWNIFTRQKKAGRLSWLGFEEFVNIVICGELSKADIVASVLTDPDPDDEEEGDDKDANITPEPVAILKEACGATDVLLMLFSEENFYGR